MGWLKRAVTKGFFVSGLKSEIGYAKKLPPSVQAEIIRYAVGYIKALENLSALGPERAPPAMRALQMEVIEARKSAGLPDPTNPASLAPTIALSLITLSLSGDSSAAREGAVAFAEWVAWLGLDMAQEMQVTPPRV
jgi:hypothetical protein